MVERGGSDDEAFAAPQAAKEVYDFGVGLDEQLHREDEDEHDFGFGEEEEFHGVAGPVDEHQLEYISEAAAQELMVSGTRQSEQRWGSACSTSLGLGVEGCHELKHGRAKR